MAGKDPAEAAGGDRPILPWRLVAGAFAHFIIPLYLVAALVDWLMRAEAGGNAESFLRHLLSFSGSFLLVYAAATLLCALAAAGLDRWLRRRRALREAADPMARRGGPSKGWPPRSGLAKAGSAPKRMQPWR